MVQYSPKDNERSNLLGKYTDRNYKDQSDKRSIVHLNHENHSMLFNSNFVCQQLTGFAHVTGMCSYYSASISLDHGYYGSVLIAAHEMGHK